MNDFQEALEAALNELLPHPWSEASLRHVCLTMTAMLQYPVNAVKVSDALDELAAAGEISMASWDRGIVRYMP